MATITDLINAAAAKYGIDPGLLLRVAGQESSLNAAAVSSKGAAGVMQLMPATAVQYGVSNPFDPPQNIDAGAHYLSDLLKRYNGDTGLALAAYNAGPGNVDKYGGVPPFPETQNYVAAILGDAATSPPVASGFDLASLLPAVTNDSLSTAALVAMGLASLVLFWFLAD
jgi:soluble lytic murein transglycosylase-like protein